MTRDQQIDRHSEPVARWPRRRALLEALEAPPWQSTGRTYEGRCIAVASAGRGPAVVLAGAVHGDEPASAYAVHRWFRDHADLVATSSRVRVVAVPVLNADGFAAHTKNNGRDVDLNRNFPTLDFGRAARPGYSPGSAPASEPETRAFLRLCARVRARAIVAVHQGLSCINFDGPALAWARAVSVACSLPVRANIGYPTPGSMGTHFGVERRVPILTLELGPRAPAREWPCARLALDAAIAHATRRLTRR